MATKKTKKNIENLKKQTVKKKLTAKMSSPKKTPAKATIKKASSFKKNNTSPEFVDLKLPPQIYLTPLDVAVWLRWQAELQFAQLRHKVITKEINEIFKRYPHIKENFLEYEIIKGSLYNTTYKYTQLIKELAEKYNINFATVAINDKTGLVTSIKKSASEDLIGIKKTEE